jgi:hypothetical protein
MVEYGTRIDASDGNHTRIGTVATSALKAVYVTVIDALTAPADAAAVASTVHGAPAATLRTVGSSEVHA